MRTLLLLLSLFARFAVPTGFMVAPAGATLSFVACPEVVAAPVHHGQGHDHDRSTHSSLCAFAGLTAPAIAADAPNFSAAVIAKPTPVQPSFYHARAPPTPAAPPPPSRAPPGLS